MGTTADCDYDFRRKGHTIQVLEKRDENSKNVSENTVPKAFTCHFFVQIILVTIPSNLDLKIQHTRL